MDFSAVILAGGQSRRMGRDKAWLEVDGQSLLARAVAKVRALGIEEIFISGRAGEDYSALNCPLLLDLKAGFGPLAGIERALHVARSPLLLVLAVDLPEMTTEFLQKLVARSDSLTGVVPKRTNGYEPLAAIYPKRSYAIAFDFISKSHHAARDFAEACRKTKAVRIINVKPADESCFANWNTPADAARTSRFI